MKFLHIWSANIILLMFIFGAIGYIFNEQKNKKIITSKLFRYYHIMIIVAIITGIGMVGINSFWIRFPTLQFKLFVTLCLVLLSIFHRRFLSAQSNVRSILTILLVICIYSISMLIGSYLNG